jgi:PAS domain S-box-containing protein
MRRVGMEVRNRPEEQVSQKRSSREANTQEVPKEKINRTRELLNVVYDALNSSAGGVIITDRKGRIIYVNPSFLKIFGYNDKSEVLDKNATDLFTKEEVKRISDVEDIIDESKGEKGEFYARHRDGTVFPVEVSASNVTDTMGNVMGRIASFIDITDRKQLEKGLRDSENKLRHLSQRILDAQEEERKLIAHELHDGLGATLTNIKYSLEQRVEDHPEEKESLDQAISMVQNAIKDTSRISRSLRPSILDDMGVIPAIRWFCRGFQEGNTGTAVETQLEIQEEEVREPLKLVIYRIVQEALNNIAKHSGAQRATVALRKTGYKLELTIEDNGEGFDSQEAGDTGMGLTSMRERTQFSGGLFSVRSSVGKGTTIRAIWPLQSRTSHQ